MTTVAPQIPGLAPRVTPVQGLRQTMTLAWRTVIRVRHNPAELGDLSVQPIIFTLLFTYVFGGAVAGDTGDYLKYMLPGGLVMHMFFVTMNSGQGLNTDLTKGVFDRLRSLPIARWAPLAGRIAADQVKQLWSILVVVIVGVILGFRPSVIGLIGSIILLLGFSLAFSWVAMLVGATAADAEKVQVLGFTILFPLTFVSNVFVPTHTMPGWLQAFVKINPVSILANACRGMMNGGPVAGPVLGSVAWAIIIMAVAAPLSVRAFKKRV